MFMIRFHFNLAQACALVFLCQAFAQAHELEVSEEASGAHLRHLLSDTLRASCSALEKGSTRKLLNWASHDVVNARVAEELHAQRKARSLLGEYMHPLDSIPNYNGSNLFEGAACVLQPLAMEGPYWVNGQQDSDGPDIVRGQEGVPMTLLLQVVDVNTCLPAEGAFVDIWHANASGLYSGVQGERNSEYDARILDENWLRGGLTADRDGIVVFNSIVPGHYYERVVHVHVAVSDGLTQRGGPFSNVYSVGQIYFEDDLVDNITVLYPYSANKVELYHLDDDSIIKQTNYEEFDPIVKYTKMGEKWEDGIFAWIRVGVDLNETLELKAANTAGGGEQYPFTEEVYRINRVIEI